MTPSELKSKVEEAGHEPYFFDRKTMRFFGDTMRNYGVRCVTIGASAQTGDSGRLAWELYRKRAVKHGNRESAYFCAITFRRIFKEGN
jgi:hypothetical protein